MTKSYRLEWYLIIWHYLNLYVYCISFIARHFLLWKLNGAKFNFESICFNRNGTFSLARLASAGAIKSSNYECVNFCNGTCNHIFFNVNTKDIADIASSGCRCRLDIVTISTISISHMILDMYKEDKRCVKFSLVHFS